MKSLFLFFLLPFFAVAQTVEIRSVTKGKNTSMRGLSVVNDNVAWVSDSNGFIGKTVDGGANWAWQQPKGYEKLDFRDIEAFDENTAVVVNAGSPAFILRTQDGGISWQEVYKNVDTAIFLDGMDFWDNQHGIIFGDPIKNSLQLLQTNDGGLSWADISHQLKIPMRTGEAGFAASGTTIRTLPGGYTWIATGGTTSNIYYSKNYGRTWKQYALPIIQGENSTGPFSMAMYNRKIGIAVGGNYVKDKENTNNVLLTEDGGKTWTKPTIPVSGYRSGVTYISKEVAIATGSSGTDISLDGGKTWKNISTANFNAVQKAKKGSLILLTGNRGQISQLVIN